MEQKDFLDFENLLKGPLVLRKTDEQNRKFVWNNCQWIKYDASFGHIAFKTSLEEEHFDKLSLRRQGKQSSVNNYIVKKAYEKLLPISKEKKSDLMGLLSLIPPVYYSLYEGLKCTEQEDIDPDLVSDFE